MLATTTEAEATPAEDVFVPLNLGLFCAIVIATLVGIPLYGYFMRNSSAFCLKSKNIFSRSFTPFANGV